MHPIDLAAARAHSPFLTSQPKRGVSRSRPRTSHPRSGTWPAITFAGLLGLACGTIAASETGARAKTKGNDDDARDNRVALPAYVVSATRIEKNPWGYAALPGFEVLSRASDNATNWWLDALRRGLWFEDNVIPKDWLSPSPVPYTVIIDDTNLETIRTRSLYTRPIEFRSPADALTWGSLSDKALVWTDRSGAFDDDTVAANTNVYEVDTRRPAYASISLERLSRCTPPLAQWTIAGLLGKDCGLFRQSFIPVVDHAGAFPFPGFSQEGGSIRKAAGPGAIWVSLDETQRLLRELKLDKKAHLDLLPLGELFAEAPPAEASLALWRSEAGLFIRWGLTGPGQKDPALSRAFLEFVRRARQEPVTELVFAECFGFGYATMEEKLESFLKTTLGQPNIVTLDFPAEFPAVNLKAAAADQIGRMLGDWLRMQGDSVRQKDPGLSQELLATAGRMLERAYRENIGLPPDPVSARPDQQPAQPELKSSAQPAVVTPESLHDSELLVVYGLYEHDTGNDVRARACLEKAAQTGAVRPRACLLLAQLRYAAAIAKPLGSKGRLSAGQAAAILEPLQAAPWRGTVPEFYRVLVDIWTRCEAKPAERDIERVAEGVSRFPRDTPLAFRAALLCARSGYTAQAAALIDHGLVFAAPKSQRDDFEHLRAALAGTRPDPIEPPMK